MNHVLVRILIMFYVTWIVVIILVLIVDEYLLVGKFSIYLDPSQHFASFFVLLL